MVKACTYVKPQLKNVKLEKTMRIFMELFFSLEPSFLLCRTSISTSHSCDGNIGAELLPKKTSLRVEDFFGALFLDYYYFFLNWFISVKNK